MTDPNTTATNHTDRSPYNWTSERWPVETPTRLMEDSPIETPHIRLLPYSAGDLLALIASESQFAERFGLPAADGLRAFMVSDEVSPTWLAQLRAAEPNTADPWVHGFAIIHRASDSVIGSAGFKGLPDAEGVVEIAYGIVPAYQGRGYATEAAAALVAFAFNHIPVKLVRAHTLPTNTASIRVLAKCGFTHKGEVVDPEDGLVWRWELSAKAGG